MSRAASLSHRHRIEDLALHFNGPDRHADLVARLCAAYTELARVSFTAAGGLLMYWQSFQDIGIAANPPLRIVGDEAVKRLMDALLAEIDRVKGLDARAIALEWNRYGNNSVVVNIGFAALA